MWRGDTSILTVPREISKAERPDPERQKQERLFAKAYTFQSTEAALVSSLKCAAQNKGNTKKGERASNSRLQERM